MIKYGADNIFKAGDNGMNQDIDIEELMRFGQQKMKQQDNEIEMDINERFGGVLDLDIETISCYTFQNQDYKEKAKKDALALEEQLKKVYIEDGAEYVIRPRKAALTALM